MSDIKAEPAEKLHYSIEEVMELFCLDQWTIRMWVDRFEIPGHLYTDDGNVLFTRQAAEQIGAICSLMKKRMKLRDIRKYLGSVDNL